MMKKPLLAAGVATAALTLISLGVVSPAALGAEPEEVAVSAKAQADYEAQLADFLRTSPEPAGIALDAPTEEQNAYWDAMSTWWEEVPWEAVAGQWGCTPGPQEVSANPVDELGVTTYGHGGVMQCSTVFGQDELSAVTQVLPRTESLARLSEAAPAQIRRCDAIGGQQDFCLTRPASGSATLTASMQWLVGSTQTGRARLGHVGVSGCSAGTQLALGAVGSGGYAAVWYATGTAAYSASFSSSFLYSSGSYYGTWCAIT